VRREVKSRVIIFSILRVLIQGYLIFRYDKFFNDLYNLSQDNTKKAVLMISVTGSKIFLNFF